MIVQEHREIYVLFFEGSTVSMPPLNSESNFRSILEFSTSCGRKIIRSNFRQQPGEGTTYTHETVKTKSTYGKSVYGKNLYARMRSNKFRYAWYTYPKIKVAFRFDIRIRRGI
jgi:hypothetical protein